MQNAAKQSLKSTATSPRHRSSPRSLAAGLVLREVAGKGKGVFATRPFAAGETVLEFKGERIQVGDVDDLTHCLQIGPTTFLSPSNGIDDFVNHSCVPNTGIQEHDGRVLLVAFRSIEVGEEISFDYSTTQAGGHWYMDCLCGSKACRGRIGDFRDLPAALRRFYIDNQAVLAFVAADSGDL